MSTILFAGFVQSLYGVLLFLTSLFLILLVLVQRGRGGGLSGAFGGAGGQSAFGAKAGDTFTKITIGAATFWIVLCLFGVKYMGSQNAPSKMVDGGSSLFDEGATDDALPPAEAEGGFEETAPAGDSAEPDAPAGDQAEPAEPPAE